MNNEDFQNLLIATVSSFFRHSTVTVFYARIIKFVMKVLKNAIVHLVLQDHNVKLQVMMFYFR